MERCSVCSEPAIHHLHAREGTDAPGVWLCDEHARELKDHLDHVGAAWHTDMVSDLREKPPKPPLEVRPGL